MDTDLARAQDGRRANLGSTMMRTPRNLRVKLGPSSRPAQFIDEMKRRIVERFRPDRIILFGSYAKGTANADSDVDLLVVMPIRGRRLDKIVEIRVALSGIGIPKDVIVATPRDIARFGGLVGSILNSALEEGRVIYERAS